ncbi:MAG: O-antigen ligase [Xanthobacteraceae bacterium]
MPGASHPSLRGLLDPQIGRIGRIPVAAALRHVYLTVILLAAWLTLAPYTSLRPEDFEPTGAGPINYIVFGLMAGMAMILVAGRRRALVSVATPAMIALWLWLAVNAVVSSSPAVSITRLTLVAISFALAASLPLLAQSEAAFDRCLAVAGWTLLALCYFGVVFLPDLAIHSQYDIVEPRLAGDWRGTFGHKNSAAPVMAALVFVGLHLARRGRLASGLLMAACAGNFLLFTGGKTATALCLYTLLSSLLMTRLAGVRAIAAVAFLPLLALNVISVGSVVYPALDSVLLMLPVDASFTGRSDIWGFVLTAIRLRPILGYGFAAFWGEPGAATLPVDNADAWAMEASHSHNGYLDLAVTVGLPGLLLCLVVFLYAPLKNYVRARRLHADGSLPVLFLQIWLFGIYLASMESVFLNRVEPGWITFLLAVMGLHYAARFPPAGLRDA